jgi:DUF1365 family protein
MTEDFIGYEGRERIPPKPPSTASEILTAAICLPIMVVVVVVTVPIWATIILIEGRR